MPIDPRLNEHKEVFELEDVMATGLAEGKEINVIFEESKHALSPGGTVKLRFNIYVPVAFGTLKDTEVAVEDLWVLIEDSKEDLFFGILANEPDEQETELKQGYGFWFHANHVLEIG